MREYSPFPVAHGPEFQVGTRMCFRFTWYQAVLQELENLASHISLHQCCQPRWASSRMWAGEMWDQQPYVNIADESEDVMS
jgi:hypothetical protein